jgi:hypothetical protein
MMSPVPIIRAIISPNEDRRSAIDHRRGGIDDGRRWGSDHNGRRGDDHRNPDTYGYPSSGMCRERQGKGG